MTVEPKVGIPTEPDGDPDRIEYETPAERDVASIREAIERKKRRENARDAQRQPPPEAA